MQYDKDILRLSASDLVRYLACGHLTALERAVAEGNLAVPSWVDPALELLRERGMAHERAYVQSLQAAGMNVIDVRAGSGTASERTLKAMQDGADAIVQADLSSGRWTGYADVLLRVDTPSDLGEWSYEVLDTKLAQETRAGTILQLCVYTDLLARLQGATPRLMHVVKPGEGLPRETFRYADFHAYYRLVRDGLENAIANAPDGTTYPDPVEYCDVCRWWQRCEKRRRDDDHLCLVAGIRTSQIDELHRQGTTTLEAFADRDEPLDAKPRKGSVETYLTIHGQARVQMDGRRKGDHVYELLEPEADRGLQRLPEPTPGDIFFDIESARFVENGGLEYLLGYAVIDHGEPTYRAIWSVNHLQEKLAVEQFIDMAMDRCRQDPLLHIYHYAPYEPAALKRLVARHGTREAELDELLRAGRFVDLYAVTRQGLRASVERYSLKCMEPFFGFTRDVDLRDASAALRRIQTALELQAPGEILDEDHQAVEQYNRDDCVSTRELRDWLEQRRDELAAQGHALNRPEPGEGAAGDEAEQRDQAVQKVFDQLVAGLPEDRSTWDDAQRAQWLLSHQLNYFRREGRAAWWEYFSLKDLDDAQSIDERKAAAELKYIADTGEGTDRCPVHRYEFPDQEVALHVGDSVHDLGGDKVGSIAAIDQAGRTLDIRKTKVAAGSHPRTVFAFDFVRPAPIDHSLLEVARSIAKHGMDGAGPYRAARDLLLRRPPRLQDDDAGGGGGGALRHAGEETLDAAIRLARNLDHGVLPIQGPPGTGKTYTGARMIVDLARAGKRIGVTAVSHKVIRNLLKEVVAASNRDGPPVEVVHKHGNEDDASGGVEVTSSNDAALDALTDGNVVGGTAWLWSRDDAVEALDYLFVDEAGQMSLSQVLGAARSAHNLVLLGDPQQLVQPRQGAHPEGAEVAALDHILDGRDTIPDDRGLFLDVTWRMHKTLCDFTSEMYYDGRLTSLPELEHQALAGTKPFEGSGLYHVPVTHHGNRNSSPEEVDAVAAILEHLTAGGVTWIDRHGESHPLTRDDILIVAPYNAHVGALTARLPRGARIGTVDRFQGQEAPVVIYTTASSSPEDAPRGMSFLYDPNRFNVATSRARCACILVAAPAILEPQCRTVEQMRYANGLCRFREMAREVAVGDIMHPRTN